jgi:hypothetical protein
MRSETGSSTRKPVAITLPDVVATALIGAAFATGAFVVWWWYAPRMQTSSFFAALMGYAILAVLLLFAELLHNRKWFAVKQKERRLPSPPLPAALLVVMLLFSIYISGALPFLELCFTFFLMPVCTGLFLWSLVNLPRRGVRREADSPTGQ